MLRTPAISSLALVVATSCSTYHAPRFNQGVGANGVVTLIVPFRESLNERWYGESETGKELALMVRDWANENAADPNVVDFASADAAQVIERLRDDWHKDSISADEWRTLVASLGVTYVVEGDLGRLRLQDPRTIGVYDASLEAEFRVINVLRGTVAYRGRRAGTYAGGHEGHDRILMRAPSGESDRRVRHVVIENLAEQIGKDLYGYTEH